MAPRLMSLAFRSWGRPASRHARLAQPAWAVRWAAAQSTKAGSPVAEHAKETEERPSGVPAHEEGSIKAPLAATPATDLFSLTNRTILVTGGARGLETGADVACLDVLAEPAEPQWSMAQQTARDRGAQLTYGHLDVTDLAHVASAFASAFDAARGTHPVRGLFHSAGIQVLQPALDLTPETFQKVISVNLNGSFNVSQAFAREWLARHPSVGGDAGAPGASVVLTGSMSGRVANFGVECAPYSASKAGVNQMVRNLALEWSKRGIRVNVSRDRHARVLNCQSLSPGYIRTALTAAMFEQRPSLQDLWVGGSLLGRLSTPDEFRGPVIYLLSDASSFMTGSDLVVDGGHTAH